MDHVYCNLLCSGKIRIGSVNEVVQCRVGEGCFGYKRRVIE